MKRNQWLGPVQQDGELALTLNVGETVGFEVPEAMSAGYAWFVAEVEGPVLVEAESVPFEQPADTPVAELLIGGFGTKRVSLLAPGPAGQARVVLREVRPFAPEQIAHELTVALTVTEGEGPSDGAKTVPPFGSGNSPFVA